MLYGASRRAAPARDYRCAGQSHQPAKCGGTVVRDEPAACAATHRCRGAEGRTHALALRRSEEIVLTQIQRLRASRRTSTPQPIGAPVKGWNTRDPFEQMDPLDAILIDNWDVAFQGLVTRNGSLNFATGMGAA